MKKKYKSREGAPFKKGDAQAIGEFIENCEDKTTNGILEKIKKNKKHKIYNYICWDNGKAAEEWRIQQVRKIVSHIVVVEVTYTGGKHQRGFFSVSQKDNGNTIQVYVTKTEALKVPSYRKQLLSQMLKISENLTETIRMFIEADK